MNEPLSAATLVERISIENRAMKFKLHRGGTQRRVRDRDAEQLVKSQMGDEGQIVSRELFKDKSSPVYKYQRVANEMYTYHISATLPWGDDSSRLLPNDAYFNYTSKMQDYISQLDQVKGEILNTWDQLVYDDVLTRNTMLSSQGKPSTASTNDYPTVEQMSRRLYVTWYPEPISTSNDFRFEIPQFMRESLDLQLNEYIEQAGQELYNRMLAPVSAFVEKLSKYNGDKGQRWHDSFVDNLNALSRELAPLNIKDDPKIKDFLKQIDDIVKPYAFQPDALKEDLTARESVRSKLAALEKQLKGYAF